MLLQLENALTLITNIHMTAETTAISGRLLPTLCLVTIKSILKRGNFLKIHSFFTLKYSIKTINKNNLLSLKKLSKLSKRTRSKSRAKRTFSYKNLSFNIEVAKRENYLIKKKNLNTDIEKKDTVKSKIIKLIFTRKCNKSSKSKIYIHDF